MLGQNEISLKLFHQVLKKKCAGPLAPLAGRYEQPSIQTYNTNAYIEGQKTLGLLQCTFLILFLYVGSYKF